jgi:nicotinamidase/pyrazinamidase
MMPPTVPFSTVPFSTDVLIVTDVQNDFLPGGALAVPRGDEVIATINALVERFAHVVLTQDWHPPGHVSFASSHPGRKPFESLVLPDGRVQILWPDHCVQGSSGAEIATALSVAKAELVIRKGYDKALDSYSVFVEADRATRTGMAAYLRERGLKRVFVTGLATDFCAGWTAIDAAAAGFETWLIEDACRAIDTDGSLARALTDMDAAGVRRVQSAEVLER